MAERKDGKRSYDAPPHSQEMQALNKKFAILHGGMYFQEVHGHKMFRHVLIDQLVSSLLNLVTFAASVTYSGELASRF
jgi:hypothetical protein